MSNNQTNTTTRRPRRAKRRSSPTMKPANKAVMKCYPDLSNASPTQTLASLRLLVLSYLADLEARLSVLESPLSELSIADSLKAKGELTIDEARAWAEDGLLMLQRIRADVHSHLPDMPDVPGFDDVHFPDMHVVRSYLSDMRSKLDGMRNTLYDIDFRQPLSYVPTLSEHLHSLHSHLSSIEIHSNMASLAPSAMIHDLLDPILSSDIFSELLNAAPDMTNGEDILEKAARDVTNAVKRSFHGSRLIKYADLPHQWQNNPFVARGYRFIPLDKWPLLILSLFAFHNETLNIHTHLIPFIMWGLNSIPFLNSSGLSDGPEMAFTAFALLCLLLSAVWHTMAGCAHPWGMEFCARVDYVGIGWLISASVGTVVYYGFQCHPDVGKVFLVCCFLTGLAGNVFPFMKWFNQIEYKNWRVAFFLSLAFFAVAPLATLTILHSPHEMWTFLRPVVPSLVSYIVGLIFYVSHIPERFLSRTWRWLDFCGGGSHAIWHGFIVLAISQHKTAMRSMRDGLVCPAP